MKGRKEHIVLYGCSQGAENFMKTHPDVMIDYFIDDTLHGRIFCDIPVYRPADRLEDLKSKYTLVFTDNTAVYDRISNVFRKQGLSEFDQYIPYQLYDRKIALTWGNCHVEYVKSYLAYSKEFSADYAFYLKKNLWDMKESDFDESIFRHCDLLVCQHIRENNSLCETFSSMNVEKYLKKDCNIIKFPNLFGMPRFLFPQTDMRDRYIRAGGGIIWYRDKVIDGYLQSAGSVDEDEIYEKVMSHEFSEKEIWDEYILFCEKLAGREKQCNIHIMDYVMEHLRDEKLFLDVEHPSKRLLGEIGDRILEALGYHRMRRDVIIPGVYAHEVMIYPSVKRILQMRWEEGDIKADNHREKIQPGYMDAEEYVRQYCMVYAESGRRLLQNVLPLSYALYVEEKEGKGIWQQECRGGMTGGTVSRGKRCSAVKIFLEGQGTGLEYRVYLHGQGWTEYVSSGGICGSEDMERYIQAVQIRLTGMEAGRYHIYYRVHCQNEGWLELCQDGETAGNVEQNLRLEAIKIEIRKAAEKCQQKWRGGVK